MELGAAPAQGDLAEFYGRCADAAAATDTGLADAASFLAATYYVAAIRQGFYFYPEEMSRVRRCGYRALLVGEDPPRLRFFRVGSGTREAYV